MHSPVLRGVRFHRRTNLDRTSLNEAETALLEVLRAWPRFAEADWAEVVSTVGELKFTGVIRFDRVFKVGMREKSPQARDLLRRLAEDLTPLVEESA
jgi:flavin-binding protein dodecin